MGLNTPVPEAIYMSSSGRLSGPAAFEAGELRGDSSALNLNMGVTPYHIINKVGRSESVGMSYTTISDIGAPYDYPESGIALSVVAENVNDGANNKQILVEGLDEDFRYKKELVILNGQAPVALSGLWFRVNEATAMFPRGDSHLGNIWVYESDDSVTAGLPDTVSKRKAKITFNSGHAYGRTMMAQFTTPGNAWGYITRIGFGSSKNDEVEVELRVSHINSSFFTIQEYIFFEGAWDRIYPNAMIEIPPKFDIEVVAKVSAGTGSVTAELGLLMVQIGA